MISITSNAEQVAVAVRALGQRAPDVIVVALNRAALIVRREAIGIVSKETASKARYIRHAIRVRPHATLRRMRAIITGAGKDIPIIDLGARKLKRGGITWRSHGKFLSHVPQGFIARMPSGHISIFVRARNSTPQLVGHITIRHKRVHSTGSDTPIATVVTQGIGRTLSNPLVLRRLEIVGDVNLVETMINGLNKALAKEDFVQ